MQAKEIALGGVFAALAVVIMLLGGVVSIAVYLCPMLASLLLLLLTPRLPRRLCWAWFGAVSVLSLLLCPDKECPALFLALGYYPLLRPGLQRLGKPVRILCKLLVFNLAIAAMYALLLLVFRLPAVTEEFKRMQLWLTAAFLLLGNVTFLFYDLLIGRLEPLFRRKS